MNNLTIINARKLAEYILNDSTLLLVSPNRCPYKDHVGALFTDIILQAGVNYNTVVAPRVNYVLRKYPNAFSVIEFCSIIESDGVKNVLKWKHPTKLKRMHDLLMFCMEHRINYSKDLQAYLKKTQNQNSFLQINGVGNKTLDYLLKLLGMETVAVDRHIFSYVEKSGIECKDYHTVKMIVEYAADILDIPRRTIDYSIWTYMSEKPMNKQLVL